VIAPCIIVEIGDVQSAMGLYCRQHFSKVLSLLFFLLCPLHKYLKYIADINNGKLQNRTQLSRVCNTQNIH